MALAVMTGCAGFTSQPVFTKFPSDFHGIQVIHLERAGRITKIPTEITRHSDSLHVVFLEAFFLTPVLDIKKSEKGIQITWLQKKQAEKVPFDLEKMVLVIDYIYSHMNFVPQPEGGLAGFMEKANVNVQLEEFKNLSQCHFPANIHLKFKDISDLSISVITKEITCGTII